MELFAIALAAIAALFGGIVLIVKRKTRRWFLWAGIGLILLFVLSLPITGFALVLVFLLLTGGSFGP